MPLPNLNSSYNKTIRQINLLETYRNNSLLLEPKYQQLIAEVILLRLFSIVENYVKEVSVKIACSANYLNGTSPTLLTLCTSMLNAETQFENFNRTKQVKAKWTNSRFTNDTIKKVIPSTESLRINLNNHSSFFEEMRVVRNHVAHRTTSTYSNYKSIILALFGANLKIQPGALLVSNKRISPRIDYYILVSKIFIYDLIKG